MNDITASSKSRAYSHMIYDQAVNQGFPADGVNRLKQELERIDRLPSGQADAIRELIADVQRGDYGRPTAS